MTTGSAGKTLSEKIWDSHVVPSERQEADRVAALGAAADGQAKPDLLYVDLHLVHEVTSAQAFEGMRVEPGSGQTVLTGDIVDQAHLHGVLERLSDFGIELVSVTPAGEEQPRGIVQ